MRISDWSSDVCSSDLLGPQLDKMVVLWAKGDPDGLAIAMNESLAATPELAKTLLWDRNARWADQLKARMDQPGTVFVAVGAGHLAGERSVQDYLKERSEEHTSELQSLMRISYAVFCLKKKKNIMTEIAAH